MASIGNKSALVWMLCSPCLRRCRYLSVASAREYATSPRQSPRGSGQTRSKFVSRTKHAPNHHWFVEPPPWGNANTLAEYLIDNIIYKDEHIVAFNKPNRLPVFDKYHHVDTLKGKAVLRPDKPEENLSVMAVLPTIMEKLNTELFVTKLTSDRYLHDLYSGVLVCAKSKDACYHVAKYCKSVKTQQTQPLTFWAVSLGVPKADQASQRYVMQQMEYEDGRIMTHIIDEISKKSMIQRVHFRVPVSHETLVKSPLAPSALVKLTSNCTYKDNLQVYMVQQLAPILGDHKYSSRIASVMGKVFLVQPENALDKPQSIPDGMQQYLEFNLQTQAVANFVPLHLHLSQVVLPKIFKENIHDKQLGKKIPTLISSKTDFIHLQADFPTYFKRTLKALKLEVPDIEKSEVIRNQVLKDNLRKKNMDRKRKTRNMKKSNNSGSEQQSNEQVYDNLTLSL